MRGAQEQRCGEAERKGSLHGFLALLAIASVTARSGSVNPASTVVALSRARQHETVMKNS